MADIAVCIPRSKERLEWGESHDDKEFFWPLRHFPKYLDRGEYVHLILRGVIRYKRKVIGFHEGQLTCEATGETWHNVHVRLSGQAERSQHTGTRVIPFRGFRYIDTVLGKASKSSRAVEPPPFLK